MSTTSTQTPEPAISDRPAVGACSGEAAKPLRADARRNRARILQAAREVFGEGGIDAQMDDIARRAGVGVGTVYRHFPTKEALLTELVREKFRRFAENTRAALAESSQPFEALAGVLRRNAALCSRDAAMQHALSGGFEQAWTEAQSEIAEFNGLVNELVVRAQDAGQMRRDVGTADLPMLMCGVASTMSHASIGFEWERHLDLVIEMLRDHLVTGQTVAPSSAPDSAAAAPTAA